jgi:hypothetical protein
MNTGGNMHATRSWVNKWGLGQYVLSITFNGGHHSILMMKMTRQIAEAYVAQGVLHEADFGEAD